MFNKPIAGGFASVRKFAGVRIVMLTVQGQQSFRNARAFERSELTVKRGLFVVTRKNH